MSGDIYFDAYMPLCQAIGFASTRWRVRTATEYEALSLRVPQRQR
jgi:hypothetical protein